MEWRYRLWHDRWRADNTFITTKEKDLLSNRIRWLINIMNHVFPPSKIQIDTDKVQIYTKPTPLTHSAHIDFFSHFSASASSVHGFISNSDKHCGVNEHATTQRRNDATTQRRNDATTLRRNDATTDDANKTKKVFLSNSIIGLPLPWRFHEERRWPYCGSKYGEVGLLAELVQKTVSSRNWRSWNQPMPGVDIYK